MPTHNQQQPGFIARYWPVILAVVVAVLADRMSDRYGWPLWQAGLVIGALIVGLAIIWRLTSPRR